MKDILSVQNNKSGCVHICKIGKDRIFRPRCKSFEIKPEDKVKVRLKTQVTCKNCLSVQESKKDIYFCKQEIKKTH